MKSVKGIQLSVTGYTFRPGSRIVKSISSPERYIDFLLYVACELSATVVNAIDTQRYSNRWKPLSVHYLRYKKMHNLSLKIWEATGHLKNSIRVFKKRDCIALGFDDRTVYPNSSLKVNLVARFLEYGSRTDHRPPARPLWRPLQIYIQKNISRYYKSYQKELKSRKLDYLLYIDK